MDARGGEVFDDRLQFGDGVVDRGEVGYGQQGGVGGDVLGDLDCVVAC